MRIPFSAEQFLALFARYNAAIWPAQLGAYALGLLVLWLALGGGARARRAVPWLLAGAWAFVGVAYHLAFFSELNPAARWFGAAFVVEAALLGLAAVKLRLTFGWSRTPRAAAGLAPALHPQRATAMTGAAGRAAGPPATR